MNSIKDKRTHLSLKQQHELILDVESEMKYNDICEKYKQEINYEKSG